MDYLLEIKNLSVEVQGRIVLKDINMKIGRHEVHVLMGPNGAGKSTLLRVIMGDPKYKIMRGSIIFEGKVINDLKVYERARLGIAMAFQNPPKVSVRLGYLLKSLSGKSYHSAVDLLGVRYLLSRNLHDGFSGGEIKKVELLLVMEQMPKLALLDEPDSGVDIDSLSLISKTINNMMEKGVTILLITHLGYILKYLNRVDMLHVMIEGNLVYSGEVEIVDEILTHGYNIFLKGREKY